MELKQKRFGFSKFVFEFSQFVVQFYIDFLKFFNLFSVLGQLIFQDSVCFTLILFFEHGDFLLELKNELIFLSHFFCDHFKGFSLFAILFDLTGEGFFHVAFEVFYLELVRVIRLFKDK